MNQYYSELARSEEKDKDLEEFIREKKIAAVRLVESIERRRTTTLEITKRVFRHQSGFIRNGAVGLVPLTMDDIAKEMDIYPSTVSRAVREKYVQTPFGVFPLKHFFASSLRDSGGCELSSVYVKELLAELVRLEDKSKPLSDEILRKKLTAEYGVVISRRTVTKYREQSKIPRYNLRRIYTKNDK